MEQIKDLSGYLARMDATMVDKCWWLSQLDENDKIDTVIDFGCAGGALGELLNSISYNKFRYIGIDNSSMMLEICRTKGLEVYNNLEELKKSANISPENTILIMNSVIHEILSYNKPMAGALFQEINDSGFKYIAIRDMALKPNTNYDFPQWDKLVITILKSQYYPRFKEFSTEVEKNRKELYIEHPIIVLEFLLKYWYSENWNREYKEQYLWQWNKYIGGCLRNYEIQYSKWFQVPYVVDKIKKDFNYDLPFPTHRKLLLHNNNYIL